MIARSPVDFSIVIVSSPAQPLAIEWSDSNGTKIDSAFPSDPSANRYDANASRSVAEIVVTPSAARSMRVCWRTGRLARLLIILLKPVSAVFSSRTDNVMLFMLNFLSCLGLKKRKRPARFWSHAGRFRLVLWRANV
jgi:hypothetical protein